MLAYACVYSFYNQDTEHIDMVEQQTEILELHTNALQILLGEAWPLPAQPSLPPTCPLSAPHPTRQAGGQNSVPTPAPSLPSALFLFLILHSLFTTGLLKFLCEGYGTCRKCLRAQILTSLCPHH